MKNSQMSKKYKMVIVDDHPIVISGISGLLGDLDTVEIVQKMESGVAILDYIENNETDLVLMDIFLPVVNGIDLCKAIKQKYPTVWSCSLSETAEVVIF